AEVDGIPALVRVRLERRDRVVVDRREVRDGADGVISPFEAETTRRLAGGAHAVWIQRELCDLRAADDGGDASRGEHQAGRGRGGDDLSADGERREPWRASLP